MTTFDLAENCQKIKSLCEEIKQTLDNSARDCYDYAQSLKLINQITQRITSINQEVTQYESDELFKQAVIAMHSSVSHWHTELKIKNKQSQNQFNQYSHTVINASLTQLQLSICGTRFLHNYGKPNHELTNQQFSVLINIFWQNCIKHKQITYELFIQQFLTFFDNAPIQSFNTFLIIEDAKVIVINEGDLIFFKNIVNKLIPGDFFNYQQLLDIKINHLINELQVSNQLLKFQSSIQKVQTISQLISFLTNYQQYTQQTNVQQHKLTQIETISKFVETNKASLFNQQFVLQNQQFITQNVIPINQNTVNQQQSILQQNINPCLSVTYFNDILFNNKLNHLQIINQMNNIITNTKKSSGDNEENINYNILQQINKFVKQQQQQQQKLVPQTMLIKIQDGNQVINQQYSQQQQQALVPNVLKTANAAPYIITRLISKESIKILSQNLKNMQKQNQQKIAKTISVFAQQFIDLFYKDLSEINIQFSQQKMFEKDVKNLLLQASEVENSSQDYFLYRDNQDCAQFITASFQKMINITINFGFLCYQDTDLLISQISGQICPFGGFSCRLVLSYFYQMQQYWNQYEAVASAFYQAQRVVLDLILCKDGYQSQIQDFIKQQRYIDIQTPRYFAASLFYLVNNTNFVINNVQLLCAAYQQINDQLNNQHSSYLNQQLEKINTMYFQKMPKITNSLLFFIESRKFKQQKQSILNNNIYLSNEFVKFQENNTQNKQKEVIAKILPNFNVYVLSPRGGGGTTVINQLNYNILYRFSTINEALNKEQIIFSPNQLINQPGQENQPWSLLTQQELIEIQQSSQQKDKNKVNKQESNQNDEVMSAGSWLSMDSQNLQQKDTQQQNINQDTSKQNLQQFMNGIKQQECLIKISQTQSSQQSQDMAQIQLQGQIPNLLQKQEQSEINYVDLLTNIPKDLFASDKQQFQQDQTQRQQIIADEYVNNKLAQASKQQQQQVKKQVPLVTFSLFKPPSTDNVVLQTINLLIEPKINFYDIPIRFLGQQYNVLSGQTQQLISEKNEKKGLLKQQQDAVKVQLQESQKQLITAISNLFGLFQKNLIHQNLKTAQQSYVGQLVHPQTRQLNEQVLVQFSGVISQQFTQYKSEQDQIVLQTQQLTLQYQQLKNNNQITDQIETQVKQGLQQLQLKLQVVQQLLQQLQQEQSIINGIQDAQKQIQHNNQQIVNFEQEINQIVQFINLQSVAPEVIQQVEQLITVQNKDFEINQQQIILFVYDATNQDAECQFSEQIAQLLLQFVKQNKKILLLGNKIDMVQFMNNELVSRVLKFAEENKAFVDHFFVSAKTGFQINDIVRTFITQSVFGVEELTEIEHPVYKS